MSASELLATFEEDPTNHKSFEALLKHCIAEDDRDFLVSIYERVPEWASDGNARIVQVLGQQARVNKEKPIADFLHFYTGKLLWKSYNDPQKAEMSFRKVKADPPEPGLLREFYLDFYAEQGNWRRLEQFLGTPELGGLDDPIEVKRVLAPLAEQRGDKEKATGFWAGVYKAAPDDAQAEDALRRLYAEVGKWHAMVDLLRNRLKRLGDDDAEQQIALHLEMIAIYRDHLNAQTKVVGEWQSILDLDESNVDALDALAIEFEGMNRWPDLVKILQRKVAVEGDPERAIALHERIATIMLERFNNANEAIKAYESILELDPTSRRAIDVLKTIYEDRRDYDNYILIAEREAELLDDGEARNAEHIKLAELASEKIRKPSVPIRMWERVLSNDPDHAGALEHLEGLYEREKDYYKLAEVLDRRVGLTSGDGEQVRLLEKLGSTYAARLDDADRAADSWRRLLEVDPQHRKALVELRKRYTAARDWENLEWFFRNYATVNEWVRTLEKEVKSVESDEDKTILLFKAAAVWQEEVGDTRRAVKNLESILEVQHDHAEAARMLVPIYRDLGSWSKLPDVYDIVLDATDDVHDRRTLLLEVAEVHETKLGALNEAFYAYQRAVSENPNAVDLHPELRRLADSSSNWDSYVGILHETVDLIEDEAERVGVLLEMGAVYRDRLQEPDAAVEYFNRVLTIDDSNAEALDALEALYDGQGANDQLVAVLDKKLRIAMASEARQGILFQLASVWAERLGANDEAEAIYREMLDEFPTDTRVHDELARIYLGETRFEPLADVLERKRDIIADQGAPAEALADIECELGMLAYGIHGAEGVRDAVDRYEAALGHHRSHTESVERLEGLLADGDERLRITRILEPVYSAQAEWPRLADVLEIQLSAAAEAEDLTEQVGLLERLAPIYRDAIESGDLAWRTYGRLFELEPHRSDVREQFERHTGELDRWQPLVDLYTKYADEPNDTAPRLAIKLAIARSWHKRLSDLEQALAFYHRALDEEPEHEESINALEEIYIRLDRSEDLLNIYKRKIDLSNDVDQKVDYLFRTSDLLRDRVGRLEDAITAAQEAMDLKPGEEAARRRLDELFTMCGMWPELAANIEQMVQRSEGDIARQVVLQTRLAGVFQHKLEDPDEAIRLYSQILEQDADNQAVLEALEGLFADDDHAPRIAPILQSYYDRHGDWQKLIDVYLVREKAADTTFDKVEWRYKVAALYEGAGKQPEMAFEQYQTAAQLEPGSDKTLQQLLRLADELDHHGELVHHLKSLVEEIDDAYRRTETHRTIAGLARDRTGDMASAEKHLRAVLDIDPADMPAVDDLVHLYRKQDANDKLVEMLRSKASMVDAQALRLDLLAEAGEISASTLGAPGQAIEIYEELHNLDPTGNRALDALEPLYEQTARWEELVDVYRQRIDRSEDTDSKKYYAALMGRVQADEQDARDDAIMTWQRILDWDPTELSALRELDALYTGQEDWFNLLETLRKTQELVDDDAWAELQFRVAKLYLSDEQLADVHQAISSYERLLARVPSHSGAIGSLKSIVAGSDDRDKAFAVLLPVLTQQGEYEALWEQYETIVKHQGVDPFLKVATLHDMAALAENKLADSIERAFGAQSRAFAVDRNNPLTIEELERLASEHGLWEELVALYLAGAKDEDDDFLALKHRLRAGSILMDELASADRAIGVYQQVYEDHSDNAEALDRLHRLYEAEGMARQLSEIIRTQVDIKIDPADKIALLGKLALVSEQQLDDPGAATEAHLEVLYIDERQPTAVAELHRLFVDKTSRLDIAERLEPLYIGDGRYVELQGLLEHKLGVVEDPLDRLQIMRQLAEINLDQMGSKEHAIHWFGQAFRADPEDDGLHARLRGLVEETDAWIEYHSVLMDGADVIDDDLRKVELWSRAAVTSRDQIGDVAEAERIYKLIRGVDEVNYSALKALDAIYVEAGRHEDLEEILVAEAAVADFDDERVVLFGRLARLYRDQLGQRDDAIKAFRELLDIDDRHRDTLLDLRRLYEEDGSYEELYAVLQQLVDASADDGERAGCTKTMARIAEQHLDRAQDAVDLWEQVLMTRPSDAEAVRELQRLHESQGSWDSLVDTFERELRMGNADEARQLELHKRSGRVLQKELDEPHRALASWEASRELAPYDRESLEALRGIYRENYQHERLGGVLVAQLESGIYDGSDELALWRELAELRTESLADATGAIDAWREVLAANGGDRDAIAQLEELYEQEGRWHDSVELYRLKLDHAPSDEAKLQTWMDMASIQEERLADKAAAAQTYADILGFQPANLEASARLERLYEEAGRFGELGDLLLNRTDHLSDPLDRLANLARLARLYDNELDQAESAFLVLRRAIEIVPDDPQTLRELARLAEVTGLWQDMLETYDHVLEHVEDEDSKLDIMLKAAEVQRDRLMDGLEAARYYERVLGLQPDNEKGLRALVDINDQLQRPGEMVLYLERLSDVVMDYGERSSLLARAARAFEEQLDDTTEAVRCWEAVLDIDDRDAQALAQLRRLHESRGDWDALVGVLERIAEAEPQREIELKLLTAHIYEDEAKLGQVDQAIGAYEEVLDINPTNASALDALEAIYGDREQWDKLVTVFERSVDAAPSDDERIEVCRKIGMLQSAIGNVDDSIDAYQRILYLSPADGGALEELEQIFIRNERYEDLIEVYEKRRNAAETEDERIASIVAMAKLYKDQLDDVDNAINAYERAVQEQPGHLPSLEALESLYRAEGLWEQVVDTIERKLALETDERVRLVLLCQQGEIYATELQDPYNATQYYERALAEQPQHEPAVDALIAIYTSEGRYTLVADNLQLKLAGAKSEHEKAAVHVELARILRDELGDADQALQHLEKAVAADPESISSLWPLAEHYMATRNWTKAMPLLDVLADKLDHTDDLSRLAMVHKNLGMAAEAMYDNDRALEEYRRASDLGQPDREVLAGLARLSYRRQSYADAERYYRELVDRFGHDLGPDEFVKIYTELGEAALKLGNINEAQEYLAKVIEHQPENDDAIEHIVEVLTAYGDWTGTIRYKERLLELRHEPLERFRIRLSIGDIYREKLNDFPAAVAAYEAAMQEGAYSKEPLLQMFQIHAQTSSYREAIRCLNQLIEMEEDTLKKATWARTIAVMYRDELDDVEQAVRYLNASLDYDLGKLDAFQTIDELLTRHKEWKLLEQNYRRMLQRVQKAGDALENRGGLLFLIYKNLGEIYRSRWKKPDHAVSAYQLASQQRPKDDAVREILADLYEKNGAPDKAIREHRTLIQMNPRRYESYHKLVEIHQAAGEHDAAWCVAGLLCTLGHATEKEAAFYHDYVAPSYAETDRRLDPTAWAQYVKPQAEDPYLGQVFDVIYSAMGKSLTGNKSIRDFGLKKKDRIPSNDSSLFMTTFKAVSALLGLPEPPTVYRGATAGFQIRETMPPVLVVGPEMLSGRTPKDLAFHIAKRLSYFHPWHLLAGYFDHPTLDLLFMAAAATVNDEYKMPIRQDLPAHEVERIVQKAGQFRGELQASLSADQRSQLEKALGEFWSRGHQPNIGTWYRQVELSANHAALLATNDIEMVGGMLRDEAAEASKLKRADKLKDIVNYVLSDQYLALRKHMGMQIQYSAGVF